MSSKKASQSQSAVLMRKLRKERADAGLVEYRVWVTPQTKAKLEKLKNRLEK